MLQRLSVRIVLAAFAATLAVLACTRTAGHQSTPLAATSAADSARMQSEIASMMARSAASWNRGDLDAFMQDYAPGSGTTFVGRNSFLHGRQEIRDVYAARFAPGGTRDSLSFQGLQVHPVAPDVAYTMAWYVLMRGDSVTARGPTTLLMRKADGRWRIVHDHSS